MADIYPCDGYDLMSYMSLEDLTPVLVEEVFLEMIHGAGPTQQLIKNMPS